MAEQEQIREVLSQLATLQQQQSALQQQVPSQSSGFLNKDQEGLGDVLRNPDQAQIDFAVNAGLGLLNPNTRAPVIQGAVQGLSALQARRAGDLAARQSAHRQATSILKDRIDNLSKQGTLLKQSADIGTAQGQLGVSRGNLTVRRQELGVKQQQADTAAGGLRLREQERQDKLSTVQQSQYIDPNSGQIFDLEQDAFGRFSIAGQPVSPGALGLVPMDRQTFEGVRADQRDIKTAGETIPKLVNLVFNPKFSAAVGQLDVRRIAAERAGIGGEIEVLNKQAHALAGDQILADLKKLGVKPTDKDLSFAKTLNVSVKSDPEVWHDKLLNEAIPYYYNRLRDTQGEGVARERVKQVVQSLPRDKFMHEPDPGGIVDQLLRPDISGTGVPSFNPDGSGGVTASGKVFTIKRNTAPSADAGTGE